MTVSHTVYRRFSVRKPSARSDLALRSPINPPVRAKAARGYHAREVRPACARSCLMRLCVYVSTHQFLQAERTRRCVVFIVVRSCSGSGRGGGMRM
jgi:hypothetical protein